MILTDHIADGFMCMPEIVHISKRAEILSEFFDGIE